MEVARGERTADRMIRGARIVNVYSGEVVPGNVVIAGSRVAYVGPAERPASDVLEAEGLYIAPGWIEPHGHSWVLYNPVSLMEGVAPAGTTSIFHDDLFFRFRGIQAFLQFTELFNKLPLRYRWLLRLESQLNQSAASDHGSVLDLLARPEVAGTSEMTRWPEVYLGSRRVLEAFIRARLLGKRVDGHAAGASQEKLNVLAAAGLSSCHEAINADDVLHRLRLGLWTVLRHSSLRPDLPELARAVAQSRIDTRRMMLTMDGPSPLFIAEGGYIDEALRVAVRAGIPPVTAIEMATINPATYFGLDEELGGIAPGRLADLVLLPDLENFRPRRVIIGGQDIARDGALLNPLPTVDWDSFGLRLKFNETPLRWWDTDGEVHVIEFVSNAITRSAGMCSWRAVPDGLLFAALLDREGRWVVRALVKGFAPRLAALATTCNTTAHILALGRDLEALRCAVAGLRRQHGGFVLASGSGVTWSYPLPVAGIMSVEPFAGAVRAQRELDQEVRAAGFSFGDLIYSLLFLTCDFLPGLRLTPEGILDVRSNSIVSAAARA